MAQLEVLNPVAQHFGHDTALAPRLQTLDKKRIGLYWNGKPGGEIALARVKELLGKKLQGAEFKLIKSSVPGPKECVEEGKTFDAIIASTGD